MNERDAHRRLSSLHARRRRRHRSSSSSSERSSSSDSSSRSSRRNRGSSRHNSRSRSPRGSEHNRRYRRQHEHHSVSRDNQDRALWGDRFRVTQRGNRHGEERGIRPVDSAKAAADARRITPNASALKAIMLGTSRSRDRMDERERARAKKKLESLGTTAETKSTR